MEAIREFMLEPNPRYSASDFFSDSRNQECSFNLFILDSKLSKVLQKVTVRASTKNCIAIRLYPDNKDISEQNPKNFFEILNYANKIIKLGCLKYSKREGRSPVFLAHLLPQNTYDPTFNKDIFLALLDTMIDQLFISMSQFLSHLNLDESEDYDESSDQNCSVCGDIWTCNCDLELSIEEEEISVLEEIYSNSENFKTIFDLDESFYCKDSQKYMYCPQNCLDEQLKLYKLSEEFWISFFGLLQIMKQERLYIQKFPLKLLMVGVIDSKIVSVKLAPAFKSVSVYNEWFSSKSVYDLKNRFEKQVLSLVFSSTKVSNIRPENYIKASALRFENYEEENLRIGQGGFANVYRNYIGDMEVAIKIPHLNKESLIQSREKIIREFSVSLLIDGENTVKPFGIIELRIRDSKLNYLKKLGIVFQYCNGESLRKKAATMTPDEIQDAMKNVADGIYNMHSKDFIHQDLKPSNIIFNNNYPIIIDLGFAVKEDQRHLSKGFTLDYADPDQIADNSPGKPADIWSFALTYIGALLNCNPYKSIILINEQKFKDIPDKREKERIKRRLYVEEIKIHKKRPPFHLIKEKVKPIVFEMLKSCLNSDPNSRPKIEDVINVLNSN